VSDETGTGALVFANTPTLVTPVLGTPTSGTLTNCTGLPVGSGISGLGTGVATFLATPSSANLASAVTDETGSGALVFANSPALSGTPTAPTATYGTNTTQVSTTAFVQAALQALYPVGSIYSSTVSTNPGTLFGFGTWVAYGAGRVLLGNGGGYTAGTTGGSADAIVVSHTHTASSTFTGTALGTHTHTATDAGHAHIYSGSVNPTDRFGYSGGGGTAGIGTPLNAGSTTASGNANISVAGASAGTPAGSVSTTVDATGSSGTGANLPPYVVVYMWNRTA
jgi:hypothetical protein